MRILKEPVVHFFLLGLVVLGLHLIIEDRPEDTSDPYLVEVFSADIDWFRTMWKKRMGREPDILEMRGRVNELIRERVLGREAENLGLDQGDPVISQGLAQKMDYLIRDLSDLREPTNADLPTFLEANAETFETPIQVTFTHIFINSDDRGEDAAAELVKKLIDDLNVRDFPPSNVDDLGEVLSLVEQLDIKNIDSLLLRKDGTLMVVAEWDVYGSVLHWDHMHFRCNAYRAELTLIPVGTYWKLAGIQLLSEERVT